MYQEGDLEIIRDSNGYYLQKLVKKTFYENKWQTVFEGYKMVRFETRKAAEDYIKEHNPSQYERMTKKEQDLLEPTVNGYIISSAGGIDEYEEF